MNKGKYNDDETTFAIELRFYESSISWWNISHSYFTIAGYPEIYYVIGIRLGYFRFGLRIIYQGRQKENDTHE